MSIPKLPILPVLSILSQLFFGRSYDFSLYLPAATPCPLVEKAKMTDNACYENRKNRLPESNQVKYHQDTKLHNVPCYKSLGVNAKELGKVKLQEYKVKKKKFFFTFFVVFSIDKSVLRVFFDLKPRLNQGKYNWGTPQGFRPWPQ